MFSMLLRSTYRCGLPPSLAARRMTRLAPFKSTFRMCNSRQITSRAFRVEPKTRVSFLVGAGASVAGVGIGVYLSKRSPVYCESSNSVCELNDAFTPLEQTSPLPK
ncbi:hypothetical protein BDZ89DRAFT_1056162 [Hymenopellis radicata]|nr:hypothetical protein BDZ89DRAFT_1056162 [Hymenopellis radicata]